MRHWLAKGYLLVVLSIHRHFVKSIRYSRRSPLKVGGLESVAWGTTLNRCRIAQRPCIDMVYAIELWLSDHLSIRDVSALGADCFTVWINPECTSQFDTVCPKWTIRAGEEESEWEGEGRSNWSPWHGQLVQKNSLVQTSKGRETLMPWAEVPNFFLALLSEVITEAPQQTGNIMLSLLHAFRKFMNNSLWSLLI